jgi:hypothetical protein
MDSLIETVRVRRSGFCYRLPYQQFLSRYKMLSLHTWPNWQGPPVEGVSYLIRDLPIPSGEFAFGRTKVFVRSPRTVSQSLRYCYPRPRLYKSQVPGCLIFLTEPIEVPWFFLDMFITLWSTCLLFHTYSLPSPMQLTLKVLKFKI